MKQARVYYNGTFAGTLEKINAELYRFVYDDEYLTNSNSKSISLTLPKSRKIHESNILFPFFFGLLTEGTNKTFQCRKLKIDEEDHFTRLIKTATHDTIGPVTIKEVTE